MKKIVTVTSLLSWFNMITGSILVVGGLIMALSSPEKLSVLTSLVLVIAIVLHSYASLQLRKSVLHPEIPLSRQTPTGIRFIGFIAMFCSLMIAANGFFILQNPAQIMQQVTIPAEAKHLNFQAILKGTAVFSMVFAVSIFLNVLFNLRILKAYILQTTHHQDD
jgi:hypothetical protein